jgi:CspA family cold shock protein
MSINGKVKWFNPTKGYGFIERDDKEKDVFVHSSAAQAASLELNEGDQLTFDVETGDKGPSAVNLQKA